MTGRWGGKGDNARALLNSETLLIKTVFQSARLPHMSQISIADGISIKGTAWTDSDYEINVGPNWWMSDLAKYDPSTLVHEMTHVWQYFNHTLTKAHAFIASVRNPEEDLYSYDLNGTWEDMGFEGQAQMIEDWYDMGMHTEGHRYFFMKHVVWSGDKSAAHLTRAELALREPDFPEEGPSAADRAIAQVTRQPLTDSYLIGLMQPRYAANDVAGYGARVRQVEQVFGTVNRSEALPLLTRLAGRKPGDKVSIYFHDHLSTPSRTKLIGILQTRAAGK